MSLQPTSLARRGRLHREKLKIVAEAVLGYELSEDCVLLVNSGRYEFRNKGVDIFIDSLGEIKKEDKLEKRVCCLHPDACIS